MNVIKSLTPIVTTITIFFTKIFEITNTVIAGHKMDDALTLISLSILLFVFWYIVTEITDVIYNTIVYFKKKTEERINQEIEYRNFRKFKEIALNNNKNDDDKLALFNKWYNEQKKQNL